MLDETQTQEGVKEITLKKFSTIQLLNFCLGFFGLQFAWQMRIILSGPVTEGLGASPLLFGLIWLAGPVTGMLVQPIVGAMSDKTHTRFGRRVPYLFLGALFASIALWLFPNSAILSEKIASVLHVPEPVFGGLIIAAIMIWVIDACVNVAQGPYRALVPDVVPPEQHSLANAYLSFAIGLGSVIAAGTAPFLRYVCNIQISIEAQFVMAALAFFLAMTWTCITIKEPKAPVKTEEKKEEVKDEKPFMKRVAEFFVSSPEVTKICVMQLFTWVGIMSLFIFFTQYVSHTVFGIPDLTNSSEEVKELYATTLVTSTNFASICFAIQNLICFLVAIPIGLLSTKYGNKKVHFISLISLVLAFLGMGFFTQNQTLILLLMSLAGIGWASILALPFAMLTEYIQKGTEGSVMGIFNIFIAGPQVLVCTLLAWFISKCSFTVERGINYHWEYAFFIGAAMLLAAAIITYSIKEKQAE